MLEPEDDLRVEVEDLLDVLGRQDLLVPVVEIHRRRRPSDGPFFSRVRRPASAR